MILKAYNIGINFTSRWCPGNCEIRSGGTIHVIDRLRPCSSYKATHLLQKCDVMPTKYQEVFVVEIAHLSARRCVAINLLEHLASITHARN